MRKKDLTMCEKDKIIFEKEVKLLRYKNIKYTKITVIFNTLSIIYKKY